MISGHRWRAIVAAAAAAARLQGPPAHHHFLTLSPLLPPFTLCDENRLLLTLRTTSFALTASTKFAPAPAHGQVQMLGGILH